MKNAFDGFISRLNTAEEKISELQDLSIESLKTKQQREQRLKKPPENPSLCTTTKGVIHMEQNARRRKELVKIVETILTEQFPKLMSDTIPQIQESQRLARKINVGKPMPRLINFKLQKIKSKEKNSEKSPRENPLPTEEQR